MLVTKASHHTYNRTPVSKLFDLKNDNEWQLLGALK